MLEENKIIRSSLVAKDVLGTVNVEDLSSLVQGICGAGRLRIDASSKS